MHRRPHPFVIRNHAGCQLRFGLGPVVQVGANPERAGHGHQEAELERYGARAVKAVGRVGYPGHHHARRICVGEAVLDREPVERVGVIRWPDLDRALQDAEVHAPAASGAGLDLELGVLRAQLVHDVVHIPDELDVDLFLLVERNRVPAGIRPVAVVVPLEKGDVVFAHQLVQPAEDVVFYVRTREVEQQLLATFGAWTTGEVHRPVRVFAVEVGVRIDHLRLDPDAEIHAEGVHTVDHRLQTVRKFLRVHVPVAQSAMIVRPLPEPAIVDHHALHAELGGFLSERNLARLIDRELGRLPGVVEHRPHFRLTGDDGVELEAMQDAGCFAATAASVAGVEGRRLKRGAGLELPGKVERIVAPGDAHLVQRCVFDGESPVTAPAQLAEPDGSILLGGLARAVDRKPGVGLMTCGPAAALDHARPLHDRLRVQLPLGIPATGEPAPLVTGAERQRPVGGLRRLERDGRLAGVLDLRPASEYAACVDVVVEMNDERSGDVLKRDLQLVGRTFAVHEVEHHAAVPVREAGLERGLGVEPCAPACVFLRRGVGGQVKGGGLRPRVHWSRAQVLGIGMATPVNCLQLAPLVHAHGVGGLADVEHPGPGGSISMNGRRLGAGRSGREREQECSGKTHVGLGRVGRFRP